MKCRACDYDTEIKCNFIRHINSKKHKDNINDEKICNGCYKVFSTISNCNRHMKSCKINYNINQSGNININGDNNTIDNSVNINIDTLNINIPNLEDVSEEYRKYFMMTIPELIQKSISDFVSKEMNRQLMYEKCDFMQFSQQFTTDILVQHCVKHGTNSCKNCIRKDGSGDRKATIIQYCDGHKLTHKEAIRVLIQGLTKDYKKNICITSLKKYDNDDGKILIKHKDLLFSLGILNSFLEQCEYLDLINFDKDIEIDQQDVIDLYEAFFKNFEKNIIANRNKFNKR